MKFRSYDGAQTQGERWGDFPVVGEHIPAAGISFADRTRVRRKHYLGDYCQTELS